MSQCWTCRTWCETRERDGWTVVACSGWFDGTCSGLPVAVSSPRPDELFVAAGLDVTVDQTRYEQVNQTIRDLWPLEPPR